MDYLCCILKLRIIIGHYYNCILGIFFYIIKIRIISKIYPGLWIAPTTLPPPLTGPLYFAYSQGDELTSTSEIFCVIRIKHQVGTEKEAMTFLFVAKVLECTLMLVVLWIGSNICNDSH